MHPGQETQWIIFYRHIVLILISGVFHVNLHGLIGDIP